jgi:hypothetical protein
MLKRYQVLLDEWLADFLKERAELHDISFSETIRVALCMYYGNMIAEMCPGYEFDFSYKKLVPMMKNPSGKNTSEEAMHKMISDIYFEARKAMDHYREQKGKGNHPPIHG